PTAAAAFEPPPPPLLWCTPPVPCEPPKDREGTLVWLGADIRGALATGEPRHPAARGAAVTGGEPLRPPPLLTGVPANAEREGGGATRGGGRPSTTCGGAAMR